jgi:hypothetical protein
MLCRLLSASVVFVPEDSTLDVSKALFANRRIFRETGVGDLLMGLPGLEFLSRNDETTEIATGFNDVDPLRDLFGLARGEDDTVPFRDPRCNF